MPDANTPIGVKCRFSDGGVAVNGVFWGMNPSPKQYYKYMAETEVAHYPVGWKFCEVLYPYEKVDTKAHD